MNTFMITYDLYTPGQKYACMEKTLKSTCPTSCKMLRSVWMVKYSGTAAQLRNVVSKCLDGNDELIVVGLSGEAAWQGPTLIKHNQWIKDALAN